MSTKPPSGWDEWAETRVSIYQGCEHRCRYCFACAQALRFKRIRSPEEWGTMWLNRKAYNKRWGKVDGVIGFPSTHDITPGNVTNCCAFLRKVLAGGNRVLIVTKAGPQVMSRLCEELADARERVEIRLTITTGIQRLADYWEPGAPPIHERLAAWRVARESGFKCSVSMEPMLDTGTTAATVRSMYVWKPDTVWIGKMNQVRRRVRIVTDEDRAQVERIEKSQTDERILLLVHALRDVPYVRWKDSIKEVIARNGATA